MLAVAILTILVRLVLLPEPAVLLVNLALIPVSPSVGVEPSICVVTTAATFLLWYIPPQTPEYLVAYSGADGRLYSHAQARRVSLAYAASAAGCPARGSRMSPRAVSPFGSWRLSVSGRSGRYDPTPWLTGARDDCTSCNAGDCTRGLIAGT